MANPSPASDPLPQRHDCHDSAAHQQSAESLPDEIRRLKEELALKTRELSCQNRLAGLGRITTNIAHEVDNNLAPLTLYLSLLERRLAGDPASLDVVARIRDGLSALQVVVGNLLKFSSERSPRWQTVPVADVIDAVLSSLEPQLQAQGVRAELSVPQGLTVVADYPMLQSALLNLALRALDTMPDGGLLAVTVVSGAAGTDLEMADSGPGLLPGVRRRGFDAATAAGAAGLGLAIAERIAQVHGGHLTAQNCPEGGTAITLHLPPPRTLKAAA